MKNLKKKKLRIFIASPSDLKNEREVFREIINELNNEPEFSKNHLLIPVGWEDTLIGKGRPQNLINEDLKDSDLIVCILWKRWGSSSGKYSSGFEEEFELANKLNKDIWLYFKDIPSCMMEDPGIQLRKVLAFRKKIESEKNFLYRLYEREETWKLLFKNDLIKYIKKQKLAFFEPVSLKNEKIFLDITEKDKMYDVFKPLLSSTKIVFDAVDKFIKLGHYTEAEEVYINGLENTFPNNPLLLLSYSSFLVKIGSYNKAIFRINELLDFIKKYDTNNSLNTLKAQLLWTLGSLYYEYSEKYELSIKYYYEAIKVFEQNKDYESLMYCCKLIIIPLGENDLDINSNKRINVLKKALNASKKIGFYNDTAGILCALATLYKETNEFDNYKDVLLEAKALLEKVTEERPRNFIEKEMKNLTNMPV